MTNDIHMQKYKTKPCTMFFQKSYCKYGNRCIYSHLLIKKNLLSYSYKVSQLVKDLSNDLFTDKMKINKTNCKTHGFKGLIDKEELSFEKISNLLYIYKHRKKLET